MTKVQVYNEAIAIAQSEINEANPVAFEAAMSAKGLALNLNEQDYQQFAMFARQARGTLVQLARQDVQIAAQEAAQAAAKAKAQAQQQNAT